MLIDLEGAHVNYVSIFGGIEHLRKLRTKAIAKLCPETTKNETSGATFYGDGGIFNEAQ
jgi:hypothetical protein